jgi:YHS domain-containing protein
MQHQMEGGQLTPEEFYQNQSIPITERPLTGAEGGRVQYKPGGLVEPGVTHYARKDPVEDVKYAKEYYEKNKPALKKAASEWYEKNKARVADYPLLDREATKIEKGPRKGQYRYSLAGKKDPITGERVGETYYFKSKEKLQEFKKKRYEKEQLSKQKQAKVIGKELEVIDNHIQTWLDNYVKKNLKNYELGDFNTFKKDLAKDFAKEVKNKKYQLSEKSKNTWIGKTASANKRTTLENLPHIQQFKNVDLVSPYYHTLFYDNYLKQNPKFAKEVRSYMNWVVDPANKVKGRQALLMDARNKFSDDVIKFFGEIQPGSQAVTQNVLAKNFPKQYRQFIVNNKRFYSEYKAISNKVEKLAGIPENSILNQMTRDSRNLRKLYNVEKLPIHLKYSTDHLISLAHAARLNDPVIAKQAVKNIVGKTYKENIEAGLKGYQGVKGTLISQFSKTKSVDKKKEIINRLNELVTEYDPGTLEYKYSPTSKSGMKINVLTKPQLTSEARFESWKNSLPKNYQKKIEFPKVKNSLIIAKTATGPARLKALNAIVATVGTAAAASLFDKFGIQSAMADTGAKSSGVTTGDFFLAGAAPLATKKGRSLYGKAAKAAFKGMGTVPGLLAVEAGIGPGIVASTGGTFSEALASPLLLEGTIRDKRIYDQLKKEGYSEDQIQVIKDSVMLRADVGDTGLHTSMIPLQEIEHKGKKFTAGDPELADIASIYDKASTVIAEEDKARLKRADEFDYLQLAKGGRVGFKLGGIDKGRRAFMKWLAGITGAGVAAGTGILKFGKTIGTGKTAIKAGDTIVQGTQGMPDWFIPLINRITNEGTDVTKKLGTIEREIVHSKKIAQGEDVTVYQNLDTGDVRVEYQSVHSEVPIQMEYKAPQVIDEGKMAGQKTNPEFSAVESEPSWTRTAPDDADLTFEGENVVGRVEDLTTDTSKLKEFGKKKKLTVKEKIEAKKKQDYRKSLEHDTQTQADYIETKYGPGPDSSDIGMDEFGNLVDEYGEIID